MKKLGIGIGAFLITLVTGLAFVLIWGNLPFSEFKKIQFPSSSRETVNELPCLDEPNIGLLKKVLRDGVAVDSTGDRCIGVEPSPRGVTLLMLSAARGQDEIVEFLIDNGANVNARDSYRDTPLAYALTSNDHQRTISFLLDKGADVNAHCDGGMTPLMSAAAQGDTAVLDLLLRRGADVNARNDLKATALMTAAGFKQQAAVEFLLANGANPNLKDNGGRTAKTYSSQGIPNDFFIVRE